MSHLRVAVAALVLVAFAAVAGCSDDAESVDAGTDPGSGTTGGEGGVAGRPGGVESGLFLEVAYVGGFLPVDLVFRQLPAVTVYEDGTVIVPGAVAAVFPGPALLPAFTGRLDEAQLQALLDAAAAAGMIGGTPDVGDGSTVIADASSARVTVVVDGDTQVVEAYALEMLGTEFGLTPEQSAAREALLDLVTAATDAATAVADEPYDPDRLRIQAAPPLDPSALDPTGPQPTEREWPAAVPVPEEGLCTALSGDPATTLEAALGEASDLTVWRAGDRTFSLMVRMILPHEPDCPDA